ncbi:SagB/ThcOx family dehydrogenase [Chloroflexota bacterium]
MGNEQRKIYLPSPIKEGEVSLVESIASRRSVRRFASEPVTQAQLSQLLWAAQGITDTSRGSRTVPSAGATYPLEVFVVCGRDGVEEVDDGIYNYNIDDHSLTLHSAGDVRAELAAASLGQGVVHRAPIDIVICKADAQTLNRYGTRGDRYVHIEVGHVGQNVYLQATALGLATVAVGAFHDEQVREALRLEEQYMPLYIMPVGKPAC